MPASESVCSDRAPIGRVGTIASAYAGAFALDRGGSQAFFLLIAGTMFAVLLSLALVQRHVPARFER